MIRLKQPLTSAICFLLIVLFLQACTKDSKNTKSDESSQADSSEQIKPKESEKAPNKLDFPDQPKEKLKPAPEASANWPVIKSMGDYDLHPPLDGPLMQSGSFGELRGNHFHAGLDLRTGGTEGKNVYSIADGYVSRIKVSTRGYGKVLYVRHGNGTTSVYGHLKTFNTDIQAYVEKQQYKKRSYSIELFPGKALKVNRGEVIALSGNTGGSAGPHLHFEIRSSRTENTINPVLYGIPIEDKLTPIVYHFMLYELDEDFKTKTGNYPRKSISIKTKQVKLKPGVYGMGVQMVDHQLDRMNKLGVHYLRLTANDKLVHSTAIEKFAFDKSRYIQTHYDYYTSRTKGSTYVKLFKEKKNPLPFYEHHNKGHIELKHGDTLKMEFKAADCTPNVRTIKFTIVGDSNAAAFYRAPIPSHTFSARSWKNSSYKSENVAISIPSRAMYQDANILVKEEGTKHTNFSKLVKVHRNVIPLHTYYNLRIKSQNIGAIDPAKLLIVNVSKNGYKVSEGGTYKAGWVETKTRSFGNYYIGIDTIAPKAKVTISNRNVYVKVSDNLAGVGKYVASIDDQWILLEYHPNMRKMIGIIPDWVKPGKHLFELKVWDERGNKTHKKFNITVQ